MRLPCIVAVSSLSFCWICKASFAERMQERNGKCCIICKQNEAAKLKVVDSLDMIFAIAGLAMEGMIYSCARFAFKQCMEKRGMS